MFIRSILIPSLLVCALCSPFILSENGTSNGRTSGSTNWNNSGSNSGPHFYASNDGTNPERLANGYQYRSPSVGASRVDYYQPRQVSTYPPNTPFENLPINSPVNSYSSDPSQPTQPSQSSQSRQPSQSMETVGFPVHRHPVTNSQPNNSVANLVPFGLAHPQPTGLSLPSPTLRSQTNPSQIVSPLQQHPGIVSPPLAASSMFNAGPPAEFAGYTPDMMAAQTFVFPGNEMGPDVTAEPLPFVPITDFAELFRFDVNPNWVKSRWKRISTNHGDADLHGLRVALVTGTNSWDLHGSLTYYFDVEHRTQRITFRGWTGDASRLVELLTRQFNFQPQPTHLAGFYAAGKSRKKPTGALLMKNPPVIYAENPTEQLAVVLEINNPDGKFELSPDIRLLIEGSMAPVDR